MPFGRLALDRRDLLGPQALGNQPPRAIDVRMRHRPACVRLERDSGAEPYLAGAIDHRAEIAAVRVRERMEESVLALEYRARSGEAFGGQPRRAIARLRRPARMHSLGPCAFGQVLDDPGGHAARDAERIDPLRGGSRSAVATPAAAPIAPNTAVG
jgi:hypothetical protein